ncbi:MAG: hypothetical protein J6Y71_09510 [Ruminococcus sp.]|nr:hypothetical protein [Ruminococcus sp.]
MRKFTKEIAALLATAAVSASAGAANASSAEEQVRTAGVAINPDAITEPVTTALDRSEFEEATVLEGTFEATTTTTTGTYLMGTQVNTTTTTTTTAFEETLTEGTCVDTTTTMVGTTTATPLIGDIIESTTEWEVTRTEGSTMYAVTTPPPYGDANGDLKLSVSDSVAILQYIANKDQYPIRSGQSNADCYEPGSGITAMDALTVLQVDAGVLSQDDLPVYPDVPSEE